LEEVREMAEVEKAKTGFKIAQGTSIWIFQLPIIFR
jgi:hypothetical protein